MDNPQATLRDQVRTALDELLPAMTADGGGAELLSCNGGVVTLGLRGSCLFCPSRSLSADALRRGVQARVNEVVEVRIIYPPV